MLEKLRDLGINVNQKDLDSVLQGVTSPGRPHLARVLVKKEIVKDVLEAFILYLGKDKPAYVKKELMNTVEAIKLVRSQRAVPVLAHPLTMRVPDLRKILVELKEAGLVGVESNYDYSHLYIKEKPGEVKEAVQDLGFIETGGSDFHGDNSHSLIGEVTVSMEVLQELRDARDSM